MFPDTGFLPRPNCLPHRTPEVAKADPPAPAAGRPAGHTRAISGTECSVHWALSAESGLLSTSVLLHLQTTMGHHEAPRGLQFYPKGIVGNLALGNKWGFLQEHGHLGHGAGRVSPAQIKSACRAEYCTRPRRVSRGPDERPGKLPATSAAGLRIDCGSTCKENLGSSVAQNMDSLRALRFYPHISETRHQTEDFDDVLSLKLGL